jgi:hypothetical protein
MLKDNVMVKGVIAQPENTTLNKSTHMSINPIFKTFNNLNGKCLKTKFKILINSNGRCL